MHWAVAPQTNQVSKNLTGLGHFMPTHFQYHKAGTTAHKADVTAHKADVTAHKSNVTAHKTGVTAHKPYVTAHKPYVTAHKTDVTAHKPYVTAHKTDVTAHKTDVTAHKTDVTAHKTDVKKIGLWVFPQAYFISNLRAECQMASPQVLTAAADAHWAGLLPIRLNSRPLISLYFELREPNAAFTYFLTSNTVSTSPPVA